MRDPATIERLERERTEWQGRLEQKRKSEEARRNLGAEIAAILGAIFFLAGVAWIYRPAALILLGLLLFAYGWGSFKQPLKRRE